MKHKLSVALAAVIGVFIGLWLADLGREPPGAPGISVGQADIRAYFSPRGGASGAIVEAVDGAAESVLVQAYGFTSEPIAAALVRAHRRGVDVRALLDKSQRGDKRSKAPALRLAGVPVWIDGRHAIAHNKVMIIDGKTVITGSFNFTASAEDRNAENLLIIRDPALAARYAANWELHRGHSEEL